MHIEVLWHHNQRMVVEVGEMEVEVEGNLVVWEELPAGIVRRNQSWNLI